MILTIVPKCILRDDDISLDDDDLNEIKSFVDEIAETVSGTSSKSKYIASKKRRSIVRHQDKKKDATKTEDKVSYWKSSDRGSSTRR